MPEQISYKRNYLKSVIARVDFESPFFDLNQGLPKEIETLIIKYFPIREPRQAVAKQLQISATEIKSQETRSTEWLFHGLKREKTLVITPAAAFVKYTEYGSFEKLIEEFSPVVANLLNHFSGIKPNRLGLRYVNEIAIDESDPFSWKDYINGNLLLRIENIPNRGFLSRVFNTLEYNFGDYSLRFQFGIHNPDFPAVVRKKVFVLDFDAFQNGPIDANEVASSFDLFHGRIQELFEFSITDRLREVMN